jgi:chromosomal replication initiation ATPase DnaA
VPAKSSDQLALDLPHRIATGREDFLVSGANEAAVAAVDAWPNWPSPVLILVGDAGSGKSHLADVWRTMSNASVVSAGKLAKDDVPSLMQSGAAIVEDAPGDKLDEVALFHLINMARETSGHLLITSAVFPAHWPVTLPDLNSRLKAAQLASLGDPDDELLRGLLVKQFGDRQLQVDEAVISYMVTRMERSFDAARSLVAKIDAQALSQRAEITRVFVSRIMQDETEPGLFDD